jgi:hypothetical protein
MDIIKAIYTLELANLQNKIKPEFLESTYIRNIIDLYKSWSSDLQKQFPNGGWRTINGAKVFINGGKVVAGLDNFNGMIDNFFKEKESKGQKETPKAEKKDQEKPVNERTTKEISQAKQKIADTMPKPIHKMSWEEFKPYGVEMAKQYSHSQPDSFYERQAKLEHDWAIKNNKSQYNVTEKQEKNSVTEGEKKNEGDSLYNKIVKNKETVTLKDVNGKEFQVKYSQDKYGISEGLQMFRDGKKISDRVMSKKEIENYLNQFEEKPESKETSKPLPKIENFTADLSDSTLNKEEKIKLIEKYSKEMGEKKSSIEAFLKHAIDRDYGKDISINNIFDLAKRIANIDKTPIKTEHIAEAVQYERDRINPDKEVDLFSLSKEEINHLIHDNRVDEPALKQRMNEIGITDKTYTKRIEELRKIKDQYNSMEDSDKNFVRSFIKLYVDKANEYGLSTEEYLQILKDVTKGKNIFETNENLNRAISKFEDIEAIHLKKQPMIESPLKDVHNTEKALERFTEKELKHIPVYNKEIVSSMIEKELKKNKEVKVRITPSQSFDFPEKATFIKLDSNGNVSFINDSDKEIKHKDKLNKNDFMEVSLKIGNSGYIGRRELSEKYHEYKKSGKNNEMVATIEKLLENKTEKSIQMDNDIQKAMTDIRLGHIKGEISTENIKKYGVEILADLYKSWSTDLMSQFPNGSWKTINGAKVFVNGGKVIAGLDGFNREIDEFFSKKDKQPKEAKEPKETPKKEENPTKTATQELENAKTKKEFFDIRYKHGNNMDIDVINKDYQDIYTKKLKEFEDKEKKEKEENPFRQTVSAGIIDSGRNTFNKDMEALAEKLLAGKDGKGFYTNGMIDKKVKLLTRDELTKDEEQYYLDNRKEILSIAEKGDGFQSIKNAIKKHQEKPKMTEKQSELFEAYKKDKKGFIDKHFTKYENEYSLKTKKQNIANLIKDAPNEEYRNMLKEVEKAIDERIAEPEKVKNEHEKAAQEVSQFVDDDDKFSFEKLKEGDFLENIKKIDAYNKKAKKAGKSPEYVMPYGIYEGQTVEITKKEPIKVRETSHEDALKGIVSNDPIKPVFQSIYHDPEGYKVATDSHKLIWVKTDVGEKSGKLINPKTGENVEGSYVNYKSVIPNHKDSKPVKLSELHSLTKQATEIKKKNNTVIID